MLNAGLIRTAMRKGNRDLQKGRVRMNPALKWIYKVKEFMKLYKIADLNHKSDNSLDQ